jgi:signal transduction histidine kinase
LNALKRALFAIASLSLLEGVVISVFILTSHYQSQPGLIVAAVLAIGWSWTFAGLFAWWRRPENRLGPLMCAVGFTFPLLGLGAVDISEVWVVGALASGLPWAVLIHLLLSYPSGFLSGRLDRWIIGLAYFDTVAIGVAGLPFYDPRQDGCPECPANPLLIDPDLHTSVPFTLQTAGGGLLLLAAVIVLIRRYRTWEADLKHSFNVVIWATGATLLLELGGLLLATAGLDLAGGFLQVAALIAVIVMPAGLLAGLLRTKVSSLEEELRERLVQLHESRARIMRAADEERRRIERDLHDGAQQRLVALALQLRMARAKADGDAARMLDAAIAELMEATGELRELARGIHPAILSDRGLDAALRSLAVRAPLPVRVTEVPAGDRLPAQVETAAYFVVAESLTNVARYSGAERAEVSVARANGAVVVEVRDDGRGGADPASGSGLRGLADRVSALDGRLEVDSPAGAGTTVRARIPCAS